MKNLKKWKMERKLLEAHGILRLKDYETAFEYFSQAYELSEGEDVYCHGMAKFGIGYCNAMQIFELGYRDKEQTGGVVKVNIPEFFEAIAWMRNGIKEAERSEEKYKKKRSMFYCMALEGLAIFLEKAAEYDDAYKTWRYRIEFGQKYAAKLTAGAQLDRLKQQSARSLAWAGRYDEAMQCYPSRETLDEILELIGGRGGNRMDCLPYVLTMAENAKDPNGRCGEEELEFANRWLSRFYRSTGSYAESLAIELDDIIGNKIGKKRNRNAIESYLGAADDFFNVSLTEYAQNALKTAYRMAEEALDLTLDADAALFYAILFRTFDVEFLTDFEKAACTVEQASVFLQKRIKMQKVKKGENAELAEEDRNAREQIAHMKSLLLDVQGNSVQALEFAELALESHEKRRQEAMVEDADWVDSAYMGLLMQNVSCILHINHARTAASDQRIREMIREIGRITEELSLLTLDQMREDSVYDIRDKVDFVLSYRMEFEDNTISAKDLYTMELSTKNIGKDIRYRQKRFLNQNHFSPKDQELNQEIRHFREEYQRVVLESDDLRGERKKIRQRQRALDVKQYRRLKESGYMFQNCSLHSLQEKLSCDGAVLEFRKFEKVDFFGGENQQDDVQNWYGGFLVTGTAVEYEALGSADDIERAVLELMEEIGADDILDAGTVSMQKLKKLQDTLLEPFRGKFKGIEKIYIVPDDELYKLSFEMMPIWEEEHAGTGNRNGGICYIASARDILRENEKFDGYQSIRIIADPEFWIPNEQGEASGGSGEERERTEADYVRSALREYKISKLKYTGLEAERIAGVFRVHNKEVEIIQGKAVQKENIFKAPADIFHFATHGFALFAQMEEIDSGERDEMPLSKRLKRLETSLEPLFCSGLFLAGAGNWLSGREAKGFGCGILTAMDILSENLQGCKLVVLAACDTGRGDVAYSGSGIEGLRSAFELAGVPVLLCTLWSVDDFVTALFMEAFYEELQGGGNPMQAICAAKYVIRSLTYEELENRGFREQAKAFFEKNMALSKSEKPFEHPKYWAGFILHGKAWCIDSSE